MRLPSGSRDGRGVVAPVAHWDDCRNALAIARLLQTERRPAPLVSTACRMAVDSACRAALEQAGLPWDGDAGRALRRLGAPEVPLKDEDGAPVASAERAIDWMAAYLRRAAPGRSWGF
ncbi:MAG TPA: hypothetical protein VFM29_04415 [Vicinamibacteria bacterium]|nr:hypothetical protein [Vicinamibacteria bacterium]